MNEREAACLARYMDACPNREGESVYIPVQTYAACMTLEPGYHATCGVEFAETYYTRARRIGVDYVMLVSNPYKINAILDLVNMRLYAMNISTPPWTVNPPMQVFQLERIDNAF